VSTIPLYAVEPEPDLTRGELERIVRVLAAPARLDSWQIRFEWDLDPDDAFAMVKPWSMYDYATIRFATDFPSWGRLAREPKRRPTSCCTSRRATTPPQSRRRERDAAWRLRGVRRERRERREGVIDRLATVIVELAGLA